MLQNQIYEWVVGVVVFLKRPINKYIQKFLTVFPILFNLSIGNVLRNKTICVRAITVPFVRTSGRKVSIPYKLLFCNCYSRKPWRVICNGDPDLNVPRKFMTSEVANDFTLKTTFSNFSFKRKESCVSLGRQYKKTYRNMINCSLIF